jgi:hypothetical protein
MTAYQKIVHAAEAARLEERPPRTSEFLCSFAQSLTAPTVTVREIVDALGDRGLGVLIAVFALPNLLPMPIPFGNAFFGLVGAILGAHLLTGVRHLVLPDFIGCRAVSTTTFQAFAPRLARILAEFENFLRPCLPAITHAGPERLIGLVCIILALVSANPIPFSHQLPAIGLTLIGLGLIERDGRAILSGMATGALGVLFLALLLVGIANGVGYLWQWM